MKPKVGLFITCLADGMRPSIPWAATRLLEHAGYEVVVPMRQTCCGQPAHNTGDSHSARLLAQKFLDEFEAFDFVVAPSGSCMGSIKTHYAELFNGHSDLLRRYEQLQPRLYELTDFLVNVAALKSLPEIFVDGSPITTAAPVYANSASSCNHAACWRCKRVSSWWRLSNVSNAAVLAAPLP